MPQRPRAIAFDVVETLFSLEGLRPRLAAAGLLNDALELWFARLLRDAFALDAVGVYPPFRAVAQGALAVSFAQRGIDPTEEQVAHILEGFGDLTPDPDVEPAFRAAREAGVRIVTLSNGGAAVTRGLLAKAGLDGFVEQVLSIDDVRRWKPRADVYHHAAASLGVVPADLALVAAHAWDVLGARRAGLTTGWVSRLERRFQPAMGAPDVEDTTLHGVVAGLLRLPSP
ncbi:MAG: haloacid dehalogenase type II [Dehalococcoidia bacterium]